MLHLSGTACKTVASAGDAAGKSAYSPGQRKWCFLVSAGRERRKSSPALVRAGPPGYRACCQCCLRAVWPQLLETHSAVSGSRDSSDSGREQRQELQHPRNAGAAAKDSSSVGFLKILCQPPLQAFRLHAGRGVSTGRGICHVPSSLLSRRRAWLGSAWGSSSQKSWKHEPKRLMLASCPTTGPWHSQRVLGLNVSSGA